jgi:hypothetical protein
MWRICLRSGASIFPTRACGAVFEIWHSYRKKFMQHAARTERLRRRDRSKINSAAKSERFAGGRNPALELGQNFAQCPIMSIPLREACPAWAAGARLAVKALRIGLAHVACETGGRESAE